MHARTLAARGHRQPAKPDQRREVFVLHLEDEPEVERLREEVGRAFSVRKRAHAACRDRADRERRQQQQHAVALAHEPRETVVKRAVYRAVAAGLIELVGPVMDRLDRRLLHHSAAETDTIRESAAARGLELLGRDDHFRGRLQLEARPRRFHLSARVSALALAREKFLKRRDQSREPRALEVRLGAHDREVELHLRRKGRMRVASALRALNRLARGERFASVALGENHRARLGRAPCRISHDISALLLLGVLAVLFLRVVAQHEDWRERDDHHDVVGDDDGAHEHAERAQRRQHGREVGVERRGRRDRRDEHRRAREPERFAHPDRARLVLGRLLRAHEPERVRHDEDVVRADAEQHEDREEVEHRHLGHAHHARVEPEREQERREDARERRERDAERARVVRERGGDEHDRADAPERVGPESERDLVRVERRIRPEHAHVLRRRRLQPRV